MTHEQFERCKKVIDDLKHELPEKVNLAELMCANAFMGSHYGWDDPLGYVMQSAIDLLTELVNSPLNENGLARCGVCGKSPTYEEFNDGFFDLDRVECCDCGVMVTSACGKSKAKWNAMRGVKETDE
jgi:hypothetical protein